MSDTRKPKILHVLPIPLFPIIGPCLRTFRQSRGALRHGCEVAILCRKPFAGRGAESERGKEQLPEGVHVFDPIPSYGNFVLRELGHLFLSWRAVLYVLKTFQPDVVHVHNYPVTLGFVTVLICSLKRIPVIYDIHDGWYESISAMEMNPVLKSLYLYTGLVLEIMSLRHCSGILTVSNALRTSIAGRAAVHIKKKPFLVMRNIDDTVFPDPACTPAEEKDTLLFSGTLFDSYIGLEDVMDILKNLRDIPGLRLIIAGDGPYRQGLERAAMKKGVADKVQFLGHIPRAQLIELIRRSKLCLIPFRKNLITAFAVPNKLFEYMALGKAFVYPDLGGFREVLGEGNAGEYPAGSVSSMKDAIRRLITDDRMRSLQGSRNRELFSRLTFEGEFSQLWNLYAGACPWMFGSGGKDYAGAPA
ncbi:MAG: glycosyltransferase family 4 protein [Nitrospirae bacterium]|nr:glycosyltransferase family 4 protein [Nitrospirota bacterium]